MYWKKGTCEECEFWKRELRAGAGKSSRGECYFHPDHPPTYDTNKCGQFKKATRREITRRTKRTEEVLSMGVSEKEYETK